MKTHPYLHPFFLILSLIFLSLVSCEKEKYDYRDKWVGSYETTSVEYYYNNMHDQATCGDFKFTSYPYWDVTKGMKDNELKIKSYDGYSNTILVLMLKDTLGNFVETSNGEEYEKGHITNRDLYFEKFEILDDSAQYDAKHTKITGSYNPNLIF